MPLSPDDSTIIVVDRLPLRTLGLLSVLDQLSQSNGFRVASVAPSEAERFVEADNRCSMIIYNVGGDSVADRRHTRLLKSLRQRAVDVPLVILSDSDRREEVVSALTIGAQGLLYAGTSPQVALQALSFILKGGSSFPRAMSTKQRRSATPDAGSAEAAQLHTMALPLAQPLTESLAKPLEGAASGTAAGELTERQKAVLARLGQGESNKAIARQLGICASTVKVHVRQLMRKMGAANRTQVAIASADGGHAETLVNGRGLKGR